MKFKRFHPFPLESQDGKKVKHTAKKVKHIIMMGDSLSDRGTLNKTLLLGCIPMSSVSGLAGHSPDGRFTNGLVWSDHVSAQVASDFTIHRLLRKKHFHHLAEVEKTQTKDDIQVHGYYNFNHYRTAEDISDAIIRGDAKVLQAIRDSYTFDNDQFINYRGKVWIRSYCEGGVSAHDYSWNLSTSIIRFFTRLIVSTLAHMREKLFAYDKEKKSSPQQKSETLIIEWSGANDLVTVNAKPSFAEVDKAIAARMDNVKKLIASGYRNFILFNLPNLALTPMFQAQSKEEQDNAQHCVEYFNTQLQKACVALQQDYPHCSADTFDINTMFEHIYNNPQQYGFDTSKLKTPYIQSKDFISPEKGLSSASGYMFYDDKHPSADLHALLAAYFYDQLERRYELLEPNKDIKRHDALSEDTLLTAFRKHYEARFNADKNSFFRGARSNLNYKDANLYAVLRHGLANKHSRTMDVLKTMGWLDQEGGLVLQEPVFKEAMMQAQVHRSLDYLSPRL